jgi:hypothetical protein
MIAVTVTSRVVYHVPVSDEREAARIALRWAADGARPEYRLDSTADAECMEDAA